MDLLCIFIGAALYFKARRQQKIVGGSDRGVRFLLFVGLGFIIVGLALFVFGFATGVEGLPS